MRVIRRLSLDNGEWEKCNLKLYLKELIRSNEQS